MTNDDSGDLVVDTGPLSHLAKAGWLSVLRSVAGVRRVIVPDAVKTELRQGVHQHPHLQLVLDADWIVVHALTSAAELDAFAGFASRLVVRDRNVGEASVLSYAQVHAATAVIDDRAGRKAAHDAGVALRPTLGLLCQGIRDGLLTIAMVSDVADHLLETSYRLPFGSGEFARWADENGIAPAANDSAE